MAPFDESIKNMRVDYSKLRKRIKQRRMTISAFQKRTGMSIADIYMMEIDELMSPEGEFRACHFLNCDISDIRDIYSLDPNDPDFEYIGNRK